jgi:hypothetical protein
MVVDNLEPLFGQIFAYPNFWYVDAHGLKLGGEEGSSSICQNPWGDGGGGSRHAEKLARGPSILGFIAFLITSFLKFALVFLYSNTLST